MKSIHGRNGCTDNLFCTPCSHGAKDAEGGSALNIERIKHLEENASKLSLVVRFEELQEAEHRVVKDTNGKCATKYNLQQRFECVSMFYPFDDGTSQGCFVEFESSKVNEEIKKMLDFCRDFLEKAEKEDIVLRNSTIEMLRKVTQ